MIDATSPATSSAAVAATPAAAPCGAGPDVLDAWSRVLRSADALAAAPEDRRAAAHDLLAGAVRSYGDACRLEGAAAVRRNAPPALGMERALDLAFGFGGSQETRAEARTFVRTTVRVLMADSGPAIEDEPDLMRLSAIGQELLRTRHFGDAGSHVLHAVDFLSFWLGDLRRSVHRGATPHSHAATPPT